MRDMMAKLSMQKRMMLYFAVPLLSVQIISTILLYSSFFEKYRNKIDYSLGQSIAQAESFVESYIHNMKYLAEIVEKNGQISSVLSSGELGSANGLDEQFREFFILKKEFDSLELSNSIYRFGLYIPYETAYTNNDYYIFPYTRLKERDDYARMEESFLRGEDYITLSEERPNIGTFELSRMLTLYHQIESAADGGRILGVCSISIHENRIAQVMENANITSNGLVYLVDVKGDGVVSSNSELFERLKEQDHFPLAGEEAVQESIKIGDTAWYVNRKNVGSAGWQMVSLIPRGEYVGQYYSMLCAAVVVAVTIAVMIITVSYFLSDYYVGRLKKLILEMQHLQGGDLSVQLPLVRQGDEIEEVYRNFNFMVDEVRRLVQEHYRLGQDVKVAELRMLQAQINPHFLYNTLDLINWIAMDYGASDIERIAWNLARFYRLSLNHGENLISIGEEAEHVQVYVNIEKFHYDDAVSLAMDIPEELKDFACLNIIFQPFVENSIVHGIVKNDEIRRCAIEIKAERKEEDILFTVKDDGPGMTKEQMEDAVSEDMDRIKGGYGIKNINFRIKLCFGKRYGIRYESTLGKGTTAYIRIPAMTMEEAKAKMA